MLATSPCYRVTSATVCVVCSHLLVHVEGLEGLHRLGKLIFHLAPSCLLRPRGKQNQFAVGNCCHCHHVPGEAGGLLQKLKSEVVPAAELSVNYKLYAASSV